MNEPDPAEPDEWEPDDHDSDLRQRTFLERHDWIPWIAAAVLVGGSAGLLHGHLN